ncbi:MAG: DUF4384 domain-containing protein [Pyrinomonadaceae bacterium]
MRFKIFITLLFIALAVGLSVVAQMQDEEGVRGAFITSRPATTSTSSSANSRAGRRRKKTKSPTGTNANQTSNSKPKSNSNKIVKTSVSGPIGLGYSLYMRDAHGDAVRVDPSREFRAGDSIRITLESNADGYLYIFHSEGEGQPEMIYPDAQLDEGDNEIEAHVPYEVPSSEAQEERLRWFTFDQNPANEHLYIVLTRDPLPVVPTGEELVAYCRNTQGGCPWHPTTEMWAQVKESMSAPVAVNKSKSYGQTQTASEHDASLRGIGLDRSAPAPSVIRMNVSSNTGILVTTLDLIHK